MYLVEFSVVKNSYISCQLDMLIGKFYNIIMCDGQYNLTSFTKVHEIPIYRNFAHL